MARQNPMVYDALLELATRIGGQYVAWADEAPNEDAARHWNAAGDEIRRQVREIDSRDAKAINAKRAELRALLASLPVEAPILAR